MKPPEYENIETKAGRVRRRIDRSLIGKGFAFGLVLGAAAGMTYPHQSGANVGGSAIVGAMAGALFFGCAAAAVIFLYETVAALVRRKPAGASHAAIKDNSDG